MPDNLIIGQNLSLTRSATSYLMLLLFMSFLADLINNRTSSFDKFHPL